MRKHFFFAYNKAFDVGEELTALLSAQLAEQINAEIINNLMDMSDSDDLVFEREEGFADMESINSLKGSLKKENKRLNNKLTPKNRGS